MSWFTIPSAALRTIVTRGPRVQYVVLIEKQGDGFTLFTPSRNSTKWAPSPINHHDVRWPLSFPVPLSRTHFTSQRARDTLHPYSIFWPIQAGAVSGWELYLLTPRKRSKTSTSSTFWTLATAIRPGRRDAGHCNTLLTTLTTYGLGV
jgi:hypothetical protein